MTVAVAMTGLPLLVALRDQLEAGAVEAPVAAATVEALDRYLERRAQSLDEAFALDRGPGQRDARTRAGRDARDELLRAAAETFWPDLPATARADELALALDRYATSSWRRERIEVVCPTRHAGTLQGELWAILRLHPTPLSSRRIRTILAANQGY